MSHTQQLRLGKTRPDELKPDRTATRTEADRHRQPGQTGKRSAKGIDVGEITGDRIVALVAEIPGHRGRNRTGDQVDLSEGCVEILSDQAAQLLSLQVMAS